MLADARRLALLDAMGVDVYRPRAKPSFESQRGSTSISQNDAGSARIAVLCAPHARTSNSFFAKLHGILGMGAENLVWIENDSSQSFQIPERIDAYLIFGTQRARALGEKLSTMEQMETVIAIVDDMPPTSMSVENKRALWRAMKPIVRRIRGTVN
jgi:hypothetical protein